MKSGFIAVLGRPNVGKSSLVNAIIGEKVSIVSPKAQTTRDKINGIYNADGVQMIFIDTPGVHKPKSKLGQYMDKCVKSAGEDVDAIVIVLDGTKKIFDSDIEFIEKYLQGAAPVFVAINKVDLGSYEKIYPLMNKLSFLTQADGQRAAIRDIVPVSARRRKNIDVLTKLLVNVMPEGPAYYPTDEITDKSECYMLCEILREKALMMLNDEIPHGIGVYMQGMYYDDNGVAHISMDIIAEKESHKSIIIGAGGEKLKAIAERARVDIERLLDAKVYMELFVKVREGWRDDALVMSDIGYELKKKQ